MPEPTVETLLAYLREHGAKYDLEAMREHLAAQGASPEAIEQAVVQYQGERLQDWPKRPSGARIALGCLAGVVLGVISFVAILFGICDFEGRGLNGGQYLALAIGIGLGVLAVWVALKPIFGKRE